MNGQADERVGLPLVGCVVVITREQRGELGRLLDEAGATVVHVPLIEVVDVEPEPRTRLDQALASQPDWVVVTSAAGADRVGALAQNSNVRLAAVGTATAQRLAAVVGRPVDLMPSRQLAVGLVDAFADEVPAPQRIVIAQADRAGDELADGLRAAGHEVEVHVAYRTLVRQPSDEERSAISTADAVLFASGSAALGWSAALGPAASDLLAPIVVAIGPTTAGAADKMFLKVTHVAADHSLAGMLHELSVAWAEADAAHDSSRRPARLSAERSTSRNDPGR